MHAKAWVCLLIAACSPAPSAPAPQPQVDAFAQRLIDAGLERTRHQVRYDGSYRRIAYPGGDVPDNIGVCTDVIIRSYRAVGIDLQRQVHEDMTAAFTAYPKIWGLRRPDANIDHRRVPNLQAFFRRRGAELPVTTEYRAGDLVTWRLSSGRPHIGLVVDRRSPDGARPMVVHNVGAGPKVEDAMFRYEITGHYRYRGVTSAADSSQ